MSEVANHGNEFMLDIAVVDVWLTFEKRSDLPEIGRSQPLAQKEPFRADYAHFEVIQIRNRRNSFVRGFVAHGHTRVILEVAAHARQIGNDRNVMRRQMLFLPHS
ncbi:hypothetical protein D3C75_713030 [compost metagenome]